MSALGQKRTSWHFKLMSTLPPKADIGSVLSDVRFVPIADIGLLLLDHFVGAAEGRRWTGKAKCLRRVVYIMTRPPSALLQHGSWLSTTAHRWWRCGARSALQPLMHG